MEVPRQSSVLWSRLMEAGHLPDLLFVLYGIWTVAWRLPLLLGAVSLVAAVEGAVEAGEAMKLHIEVVMKSIKMKIRGCCLKDKELT